MNNPTKKSTTPINYKIPAIALLIAVAAFFFGFGVKTSTDPQPPVQSVTATPTAQPVCAVWQGDRWGGSTCISWK